MNSKAQGPKVAKSSALFGFRVVLNVLLAAAFVATFYVTASTRTAALAPYAVERGQVSVVEYAAIRTAQEDNTPQWSDVAADFPTCSALDGNLHDAVVVVDQHAVAKRMSFDKAWSVSHDDSWANDVWAVGGC